ncbi:hypothetical protein [Psychrobacter sp. LFX-11D]|nr:hypothetical protein [Psychrobacter sp. LFX-11D]
MQLLRLVVDALQPFGIFVKLSLSVTIMEDDPYCLCQSSLSAMFATGHNN